MNVNSERKNLFFMAAGVGVFFALVTGLAGCGNQNADESSAGQSALEALISTQKIDSHAHVHPSEDFIASEEEFIGKLESLNMKWFIICTGGMRWERLQLQVENAGRLNPKYPDRISWATSFNLTNWENPDWEKETIAFIQDGFDKGAVAVKVWKDIGMVLKDPNGSYVMIDDPRFDPVFDYIERSGKTLVGHLGEPRNCWLPIEEMTVNGDRSYFSENPQYHAYQHPEIPDYWKQIEARDNVLEKHPNLRFVGCHLGSLEFDTDELAKRLDQYPNFAADMSARICHFQVQDREKVRNFIIAYQDRLMYGTDLSTGSSGSIADAMRRAEETYRDDFRYFATDEDMETTQFEGTFRGLALPWDVLEKIFFTNAKKWYPGI